MVMQRNADLGCVKLIAASESWTSRNGMANL